MCATLMLDAGYNGEPVGHGLCAQESTVCVCALVGKKDALIITR